MVIQKLMVHDPVKTFTTMGRNAEFWVASKA